MKRLSLLALVMAGVFALSGAALAWSWTPTYGPGDTKTQIMTGKIRVQFTVPNVGAPTTFWVYKHSKANARDFVYVSGVIYNGPGNISGVGAGWDSVFEYAYYDDSSYTDYEEYYYLVTTTAGGTAANLARLDNYVVARAFPPGQTRHGEFSEYTNACTGCHGLHSSQSKLTTAEGYGKLLKAATQTDLCATCHDGTGSKYDLVRGKVRYSSSPQPDDPESPAGPFGQQLKLMAGAAATTSVHNVWRDVYSGDLDTSGNLNLGTLTTRRAAAIWQAPGSGFVYKDDATGWLAGTPGGAWTQPLACTACHEPHNKYKNFRLLRGEFIANTAFDLQTGVSAYAYKMVENLVIRGVSEVDASVKVAGTKFLDNVTQSDLQNVTTSRVYRGISDFCMVCHRLWFKHDDGSGGGDGNPSYDGTWGMKRHPVNAWQNKKPSDLIGTPKIIDDGGAGATQKRLKDLNVGTANGYTNYVPLEGNNTGTNYNQNNLICLTCHVAHGTTKAAGGTDSSGTESQLDVAYRNYLLNARSASAAVYDRDLVTNYIYYVSDRSLGVSSVLARLQPFSSVCYRCHSTKQ